MGPAGGVFVLFFLLWIVLWGGIGAAVANSRDISTGVGFLLSRPWRFHDGIWWATDDIGVEHRLDERAGRWYRQGESPQG